MRVEEKIDGYRAILFDSEEEFLEELRKVLKELPKEKVEVITPVHVEEVDELLNSHPHKSKIKYFTLTGALTGFFSGYALATYAHYSWDWPPIILQGKPLFGLTAFFVIAYELTILFGGIATFIGLLILGKLPSVKRIKKPLDFGNKFVILIKEG